HSKVNELIKEGKIKPGDALASEIQSMITRSIGTLSRVSIDYKTEALHILGLSEGATEQEIDAACNNLSEALMPKNPLLSLSADQQKHVSLLYMARQVLLPDRSLYPDPYAEAIDYQDDIERRIRSRAAMHKKQTLTPIQQELLDQALTHGLQEVARVKGVDEKTVTSLRAHVSARPNWSKTCIQLYVSCMEEDGYTVENPFKGSLYPFAEWMRSALATERAQQYKEKYETPEGGDAPHLLCDFMQQIDYTKDVAGRSYKALRIEELYGNRFYSIAQFIERINEVFIQPVCPEAVINFKAICAQAQDLERADKPASEGRF
ncbi:MAG: hypothetical protein ACOYJ2_08270, partial [Rickettsiales bacterium]